MSETSNTSKGAGGAKFHLKNWVDYRRHEDAIELNKKNGQELYGKMEFSVYLREQKEEWLKDLVKFQRRFQDSFIWIDDGKLSGNRIFQIKFLPSVPRKEIKNLPFQIVEGYLVFQIELTKEYPKVPPIFEWFNSGIEESYRVALQELLPLYFSKKCSSSLLK